MTNQEAKFTLAAYRANGRDADNPMFREALDQVRLDPALAAWWTRAQAHDAAVAARLAEVAPPAGLREAILAGARASRRPRVRWTGWLALAAGVAVLLSAGLIAWPRRAAAESARLTAFAIDDTAHGQHGGHGGPTGAMQAMLGASSTRLGAGLPVDFATLRSTGCRTLDFQGHAVLEICFSRDGKWFHCYIARRADFPSLAETAAVITERAQLASAAWSDATYHFVVVSEAGVDAVRKLL